MAPIHEVNGDSYILGRDFLASTRLHLQHYIWQSCLSSRLQQCMEIRPGDKVADLGAGNCVWITELSNKHPEASFHAFDISSDQYPPQAFLPSNLHLHLLDIFAPLPTEYMEAFDVIHVRMFQAIVPGGDPRSMLKRVKAMLKPGGRLQWDEFEYNTFRVVTPDRADGKSYVDEMKVLLDRTFASRGLEFFWITRLAYEMGQIGFEVIQDCPMQLPKHLYQAMTENYRLVIRDLRNRMAKEWGNRLVTDDALSFEELEVLASKENTRGVCYVVDLMTVVARKAKAESNGPKASIQALSESVKPVEG